MSDDAPLGFAHNHSVEELRAYRGLTAEQKLAWLHSAWRMTVDFLPAAKLQIYQGMRQGRDRRKNKEEADRALRVCLESLMASDDVSAEEGAPPGELALRIVRTLTNGSARYARVWFVEESANYMVQWGAFGNPFQSPLNFDARTHGSLSHVVSFVRAWLADLVEWTALPSGRE